MNTSEKTKCHGIIHAATTTAAGIGAGLAQLPGSDAIPITTIQVGMIISLGAVFGKEIDKTVGTTILGGVAGAVGGRTVSQFLVGWIPGFGNAINATTAFTITEAIGWLVANGFDQERQEKKLEERQHHGHHKQNPEVAAQELQVEKSQKTRTWPALLFTIVVLPAILLLLCFLVDEFATVTIKMLGLSNTLNLTIIGVIKLAIVALIDIIIFYVFARTNRVRQIISYSNLIALVTNILCSLFIILRSDEVSSNFADMIGELSLDFKGLVGLCKILFAMPGLHITLILVVLFWILRSIKVRMLLREYIVVLKK